MDVTHITRTPWFYDMHDTLHVIDLMLHVMDLVLRATLPDLPHHEISLQVITYLLRIFTRPKNFMGWPRVIGELSRALLLLRIEERDYLTIWKLVLMADDCTYTSPLSRLTS